MTEAYSLARGAGNGQPEAARIGVFICHCGGNISDVVDVQRVAREIGELDGVVNSDTLTFACADPGQVRIEKVIQEYDLNRVIVAACSPSLHELTFRRVLQRAGLNPYLFEHVNIREHVSWVVKDPELATQKTIRLVAAAVERIKHLVPLEKRRIPVQQRALVIGGGVAGMTAARDLAECGIRVTLVENEPFLGGRLGRLHTVFPTGQRGSDVLAPLIEEVVNHPLVDVLVNADVISAEGQVGDFRSRIRITPRGVNEHLKYAGNAIAACPEETVNEFDYGLSRRKAIHMAYPGCYPPLPAIDWRTCTKCGKCVAAVADKGIDLDEEPREIEIESGVIIMATGNTPYEPVYGEFGSIIFPEVVTLQQLNRMLDPMGPTGGRLGIFGRRIERVAFIHCVGARQMEGVCAPQPDGKIKDYCARTCCTGALHASREIRKALPGVQIAHFYQDIRTYGRKHEEYYEQASKDGTLFFRYDPHHPPTVVKDANGNGNLLVSAGDLLSGGLEVEMPADLVVLATGVGPHDYSILADLYCCAIGADDFLLEVHPKLRPVELAVSGVFLAGSCRGPMDITESTAAAAAAASKAAAMIVQGEIEKDPFVAKVDEELCTGCQTCLLVCPYEAITRDEQREIAVISEATCAGCGTCVAACPSNAIQQLGFNDDEVLSEVLALLRRPAENEPVTAQ